MPAALTRSDRRRTRNRDAILSAAETLFGARGIEAVSIDEIAEAADLAKGTVYNHFADKDALAAEIAAAARADGEARVRQANAGLSDPVRRTIRGVLVFARFAAERPDRARAMMRLTPGTADPFAPVNEGLHRDVATGLASGAFTGEIESATLLVLGLAQVLIARIVGGRLDRDAAQILAQNAGALALRGLGLASDAAITTAAAEAADIFMGD